jgi:hypothetical protein
VSALPKLHELASQAGIELPAALGKVGERSTPVVEEDGKPAR